MPSISQYSSNTTTIVSPRGIQQANKSAIVSIRLRAREGTHHHKQQATHQRTPSSATMYVNFALVPVPPPVFCSYVLLSACPSAYPPPALPIPAGHPHHTHQCFRKV